MQREDQIDLPGILAQLEMELRIAIALRRSRRLRLNLLQDRPELLVRFPRKSAWMNVTSDSLSITRERLCERQGVATMRFSDLVDDVRLVSDPTSARIVAFASDRARRIVLDLLSQGHWSYLALAEWAPVVEVSLYAMAAKIVAVLDVVRPRVLGACTVGRPDADGLAIGYRTMVDVLGRVTLVSTEAGGSWLADVAADLIGTKWTPSYALSRERDVRSTVIAARAASRFGRTAVEQYLIALRSAKTSMGALDALVGLTAIGLGDGAEREVLVAALDHEHANLAERDGRLPRVVETGFEEALWLLREGPSTHRIATDRRQDPFGRGVSGRMVAFELIAPAVRSSAPSLARAWNDARTEPPTLARNILTRAWVDDVGAPDLSAYPDHAFGRA